LFLKKRPILAGAHSYPVVPGSLSIPWIATFFGKKTFDDVKSAVERLWNREIKLDQNGSALRWVVQKDMYHENEGKVTLHFSSKIIPYLSTLKENFTKYRLEWVSTFKSTHSIRIYELLIQHEWQHTGERELELHWLKNILQVSDKYSRTNNFIQKLLTYRRYSTIRL
jgi:plasmid replication initiation protein